MIVCVYDNTTKTYFKSEVYAKINTGWYEKQLVKVPNADGEYFKFVDYLDKTYTPSKVLINMILPNIPSDWIGIKSASVEKNLEGYENMIYDEIKFFEYIGFSWLFNDKPTLTKLLKGESILLKGSIFEDKLLSSYKSGWNYIETQYDIDQLMNQTAGFHDSIIKTINYVSGGYVEINKSMQACDSLRKATFIIDSQISDSIEIVFEGITALNIRPAADNCSAEIYQASLFIQDCLIFFSDDIVTAFDTSHNGTWITSYSARWRFISN